MKKIMSLFLSAAMVLGLSGCALLLALSLVA